MLLSKGQGIFLPNPLKTQPALEASSSCKLAGLDPLLQRTPGGRQKDEASGRGGNTEGWCQQHATLGRLLGVGEEG